MPRINKISKPTPRKLFRGAFQPDLENALVQEITAVKAGQGPFAPVTVIVPTRLLGLHLQRTLARQLTGHANLHFQTLDELQSADALPSPLALELLCRQIARGLPAAGYFAPVGDTVGFAKALRATFTDLREAGLATFPGTTAKHRELAAAYRQFCDWLAKSVPVQSPITDHQSPIFLYGFYDLNTVQKKLVEQLAPAAIFFPATAHDDYSRPLLNWFQSIGYSCAVTLSEAKGLATAIDSEFLRFAQDDKQVSIVSCPGEAAEVREAIRAIGDYLAQNPDKTFADCAILCRSRDQYDAILRDTLPALGVRAFFRGGRPLSEHPDARLFLLLLEAIRSDFSRAAVLELACHLGPHSQWDAESVRLGIVGGQAQWEARLEAGAFADFVRQVVTAGAALPAQGAWPVMISAALAAFHQFGGRHPAVTAAIQSLAELEIVESPVSRDTFAEFCQQVLDSTPEQPEKFRGGGVFVSDVMGARGLSFDFVVVLGLVEKSFPRLVREDPLLLDEEREQVSVDLPLKRRGHDEERLLFDLACGVARTQLVLSYPRLDAGTARPRLPSVLLLEATGAKDFQSLPCRQTPSPDARAVDEREFDLAALARLAKAEEYLAGISPLIASGVAGERHRWRDEGLTRYDGLLECSAAHALLRERFDLEKLVSSATALENFFGCPFYYFQKQILRVQKWEEPEAAIVIAAADLGSLYHAILEDYFRSGGALPAVIEKHFQQFERDGVTGYPTVWEIKKEIIRQELTAFASREARRLGTDWVPSDFEKAFENLLVAPPVRLRGKIDRIDRSADGRRARVLDYKTGKLPAGLREDSLAGGEALQLPLYLLAAEQLLPGVTVEAASYYYFTLRGGYRDIGFSRAALAACRTELNQLLQVAADMIRAGVFAQNATQDNCRNCDYRPICGNGVLKLAERKAGDARLSAFHTSKAAAV